mmetsp:Transcript_9840/g.20880  ORF Transcript_9840/g.20880 Transcript_9840/m.20880 type:complete len:207 (-) Transcript_9840:290-910(-)
MLVAQHRLGEFLTEPLPEEVLQAGHVNLSIVLVQQALQVHQELRPGGDVVLPRPDTVGHPEPCPLALLALLGERIGHPAALPLAQDLRVADEALHDGAELAQAQGGKRYPYPRAQPLRNGILVVAHIRGGRPSSFQEACFDPLQELRWWGSLPLKLLRVVREAFEAWRFKAVVQEHHETCFEPLRGEALLMMGAKANPLILGLFQA